MSARYTPFSRTSAYPPTAEPEVDPQTETPIAPMVPPARGAPGLQPPPTHYGTAFWLKVTAREDGAFTVTNAHNAFAKTYAARPAR